MEETSTSMSCIPILWPKTRNILLSAQCLAEIFRRPELVYLPPYDETTRKKKGRRRGRENLWPFQSELKEYAYQEELSRPYLELEVYPWVGCFAEQVKGRETVRLKMRMVPLLSWSEALFRRPEWSIRWGHCLPANHLHLWTSTLEEIEEIRENPFSSDFVLKTLAPW